MISCKVDSPGSPPEILRLRWQEGHATIVRHGVFRAGGKGVGQVNAEYRKARRVFRRVCRIRGRLAGSRMLEVRKIDEHMKIRVF